MATISENLIALQTAKSNIKTAIENKGVDLTDVPFTDYHTKIADIGKKLPQIINRTVTEITAEDLEGVTIIGRYAFAGCTSLTSVVIPDSVTTIGENAFLDCDSLDYNDYDNAKYLGNQTNSYRALIIAKSTDITSCEVNSGIKVISFGAFKDCNLLESITIPFVGSTLNGASNTHFGYIFGASSYDKNKNYVPTSLKTVIITGGNSIGASAFQDCSGLTSVTIPNSVTSIGSNAFYSCHKLTSVTIPDSVTSIGDHAFWDCKGLTSLTISDSVTSLTAFVFAWCTSLTSVTIPNSITIIGNGAFQYCRGLTSITIPNSVTSIGYSSFAGCSGLTEIILNSTTPPTIQSSTFSNTTCIFKVPASALDAYKTATNWSAYADRIQAITEG